MLITNTVIPQKNNKNFKDLKETKDIITSVISSKPLNPLFPHYHIYKCLHFLLSFRYHFLTFIKTIL
jgi:hypothetical protein